MQFGNVSFYHSDAGVNARTALTAQHEKEIHILNDASTPLQSADLDSTTAASNDQIVQIDDELVQIEEAVSCSRDEEEEEDDQDHVPVLFPNEKRAYILVRNPGGHHAASNGSKSESSKGTTSMPSEDSKGSYVSNGSTSNGYVMGILKQRRSNNAEC